MPMPRTGKGPARIPSRKKGGKKKGRANACSVATRPFFLTRRALAYCLVLLSCSRDRDRTEVSVEVTCQLVASNGARKAQCQCLTLCINSRCKGHGVVDNGNVAQRSRTQITGRQRAGQVRLDVQCGNHRAYWSLDADIPHADEWIGRSGGAGSQEQGCSNDDGGHRYSFHDFPFF